MNILFNKNFHSNSLKIFSKNIRKALSELSQVLQFFKEYRRNESGAHLAESYSRFL